MVYRPHHSLQETVQDGEAINDVCGGYSLSHPHIDLASLPLGALRRAQRALARAQAEENPGDSEEDEGSESESGPEEVSVSGKDSKPNAHRPEWSNKPRTDIAKRGNKNA